jgi:hypothetical protein
MRSDRLPDELLDLGRALRLPAVDEDVVTQHVVARLATSDADVLVPRTPRRRWRPALAAVAAVVIMLALTPPVRAAVTDWFGVIVRPGPSAESGSVPSVEGGPVPPAESELTLEAATELVAFDPTLPAALGRPDGVEVSADLRVLSLTWTEPGGVLRLDQFEGHLGPAFAKHAEVVEVDLDGRTAIWFSGPHYLTTVDASGREHTEADRSAGPTLIWQPDQVTFRLEGAEWDRAVEIARSVGGTG